MFALALALLPPSARLRGRARGRRARARAGRGAARRTVARPRLLPGIGARRARRPLGARPDVCRAREGAVRGALRRGNVGRLLNNLGVIEFLLGGRRGSERFKRRTRIALEIDRSEDAATAVSSLAQVHLRTGDLEAGRGAGADRARDHRRARRHARRIGNARLVLGRSLLEQDGSTRRRAVFAGRRHVRQSLVRLAPRCRMDRPGGLATRRGDQRGRRCCIAARPKRSRTSGSSGRRCSLWHRSLPSLCSVAR